ncbi:hypothetical protein MKJ04_16510 [Pontibacter sp. E15-1]|uniref:hypothetical protein n=1 Tax=Pontibacter sp. E15-1 TaxID=2919918 RepID=UPI001F4F5D71|nr:hypothetical protein [Pontibacter sp. E15-1]MCJ8166449.1 hypothetical protein [Pontibacter sp. E15-1]
MEELEKIVSELEDIQQLYGIGAVVFVIVLAISGFALWSFFKKRIEKVAEGITEKNLKTFQSGIDKELVKFSTKHQKQVDAVHDCYQRFQELQSFVKFLVFGEKFTAPMDTNDEINHLSSIRLEFKRSYNRNKILFPVALNDKIKSLFPELDKFIQDYIDGVLPWIDSGQNTEQSEGELMVAGIWPSGKLEDTLEVMEEINKEIELEFRKIYGTDEK